MRKKRFKPYKGVKSRMGKKNWENKTVEVNIEKPSKKKEIEIEVTEKPRYVYDNVPEFKDFVTLDGAKLKNMSDLAGNLEDMDDHVYKHHANEEKNDFSQWVGDVMEDEELSQALVGQERKEAHVTVLKHMLKKLKR